MPVPHGTVRYRHGTSTVPCPYRNAVRAYRDTQVHGDRKEVINWIFEQLDKIARERGTVEADDVTQLLAAAVGEEPALDRTPIEVDEYVVQEASDERPDILPPIESGEEDEDV